MSSINTRTRSAVATDMNQSKLAPVTPSILLPITVTIIVASIYLATVYPSVTGGDSGELIMTGCKAGIAHPPGYPTYTMMAWLWIQITNFVLPLTQKAWRINCMCALCGSVAAGLIAWSTATLASVTSADSKTSRLSSSLVGLYAGISFALMPTVWLYSIQGEVFALNNMLCALLITLTVKYYLVDERVASQHATVGATKKEGEGKSADSKKPSSVGVDSSVSSNTLVYSAYLGAFVCGLCLTNQHTTVFPVIVTSAFITWSLFTHKQLTIARVFKLIGCVLLGMTPYLYILIRSHWRVIDSWGDQRTLRGFLTHLLREEYGTFQLAATEISQDPGMWSRLQVYGTNMRAEMMLITPILAVIGLWASFRSSAWSIRRITLVLFLSCFVYVGVFHKLANLDLRPLFLGVQARFWQQSNMYIWMWSGIGIKYICQTIENVFTSPKKSSSGAASTTTSSSAMSQALTAIYTLAFVGTHFYLQFPIHDQHKNDSFWKAGLAIVNSFPENSIVLLNGDLNNNIIKYPQDCENVREDLSLVSLQLMSWDWFVPIQRKNYPNVVFPGVRYHINTPKSFNIKKFLDANINNPKASGGIFLCGPFKEGDHSNIRTKEPLAQHYVEHPFGLCNQLLPFGTQPQNLTSFLRQGWSGVARWSTLPPFESWKYGEETWEMVLYKDNLIRLTHLTSYASYHSNQDMTNIPLLQLAYEMTEEMRLMEPWLLHFGLMNAHEYRSAGVIYGLWSKHLASIGRHKESEACGRRLYFAWRKYHALTPNDNEIFPTLRDEFNPYVGVLMVGLDTDPEYLNLPPLVTQTTTTPQPPSTTAKSTPAKKSTKSSTSSDTKTATPTGSKTKKSS